MDSIIKINAQTNGREKLIRLAYFSCMLSRNLIIKDGELNNDSIKRLQRLEDILDITRKILHFGRTIDVFNSTFNSLTIKDTVFQLTISLSRISTSIYLLLDHLVLLKRLNFIYKDNERSYLNLSQRFLFIALTMNLTRDLYEINNFINTYKSKKRNQLNRNQSLINRSNPDNIELEFNEYLNLFKINRHITADTIKNFMDLLICYSSLQKPDHKYNAKLISIFGICSSILGLLPIIKYSYRLSP